jgi:hypothetical protein
VSLRYPPRAARGLARLKRHYNEIEIFVEDTKNRNMWIELIRRVIPKNVRLKSINQLGGRDQVLAACKADQAEDGRKKLYIIDGDFDHIVGRSKPRLKFLYRLRSYCVENLFVHAGSVAYIGAASKPEWTDADIEREFAFQQWYADTASLLKPLFRAYAVVNKVAPSIATTAYSVTKLYKNSAKGPGLDKGKVYSRIFKILRLAMICSSKNEVRDAWRKVSAKINTLSMVQCVSGKDYLMPIFSARINKVLSFRGNGEQLKVHLARAFEPSVEPWLSRRLITLCS